ncbi:MAG: sigma-70 family RNA polymerase sigma factor [Burkholderiales bacterium]|nr:sigma-70 family RNA polymerase sigma factor [Nitrosomonas sp.]MCP5276261.1 sigma-70 family RNA polymerase sigma factor [Burkholderiales bacterium]
MTKIATDLEMLMQQALAGDKRAYAELLRETALFLRPFLKQKLSAENEVDDLLQEILLSIHKVRHTYDGLRPYKPWAYAIAKYRLLDYLRVHYADRLRSAIDMSELENALQDNVTEYRISYESISGEIRKLPEKQALIMKMMHQEGYTAKEIAERIGMTENAVKVAAHRAYKALKHQLEE